MELEWDEAKNEANKAKHGIGFEEFHGWDGDPIIIPDQRRDYGEARYLAFGRMGGLPHALVFTFRGSAMRIISFRRAHQEEIEEYE